SDLARESLLAQFLGVGEPQDGSAFTVMSTVVPSREPIADRIDGDASLTCAGWEGDDRATARLIEDFAHLGLNLALKVLKRLQFQSTLEVLVIRRSLGRGDSCIFRRKADRGNELECSSLTRVPSTRRHNSAFLSDKFSGSRIAEEVDAVLNDQRGRELSLAAAPILTRQLLPCASYGINEIPE